MKRKVLSVLLTCALVFSSFTGIGIPVKAAGTEEARTNYALSSNGATASASAQYGNMTPDKINDGIIGTGNERWSSEQGASQWASINFGGAKTFDEFRLYWESVNVNAQLFHIDVSETGEDESWETIYTSQDLTGGHGASTTVKLENRITKQYVRVTVDKMFGYNSVSIREFEILSPEGLEASAEARYNTTRIHWNDVSSAATYEVYRGEGTDPLTTVNDLEGRENEYDYVDASGVGQQYSYTVVAKDQEGNEVDRTESVQDQYPTGIEAVQKHAAEEQLHIDLAYTASAGAEIGRTFANNRFYSATKEEVDRVKNLEEGIVLVSFKPQTLPVSQRGILFVAKNKAVSLSTATGNTDQQDAIFAATDLRNGVSGVRFGMKGGLQWGTNSTDIASSGWTTYGVRNKKYKNEAGVEQNTYMKSSSATNPTQFNSDQWDGFFSRTDAEIDSVTIGAALNGGVPGAAYNGEIAYLTVTDELMSNAEMNAYVQAVTESLNNNTDVPTVQSLNVNTDNMKKTTYDIGTEFEPDGIVVERVYSDGQKRTADLSELTFDYDFSSEGTQTVTVHHAGLTATFEVTVENIPVKSIAITALPEQTEYTIGDSALNTKGTVVTATFDDDSTAIVSLDNTNLTFSTPDFSAVGKKTVTVTYKGKTATFEIAVRGETLIAIDRETLYKNAKANSWSGSGNDGPANYAFDGNNNTVWHANYGSGGGGNLPGVPNGIASDENPIWIQTGFDARKAVKKLTYAPKASGDNCITKYAVAVANIDDPTGEPTDDDFRIVQTGELTQNAVVKELVLDNAVQATHVRLIAYLAQGNSGHPSARQIEVYALEPLAEQIQVTTNPDKMVYGKGESFVKDGMVVTATYDDGTTGDVAADVTVLPSGNFNDIGTAEVTLSYQGKTATLEVDVTYNVAEYKTNASDPTTWTSPEKEGYVFAGWYLDKDFTQVCNATTGPAYAKFVNEAVLSTKGQVPMNAKDIIEGSEDKTRLRLVSTIDDCLDYKQVGFHIKYTYNGTDFDFDTVSTKVYDALFDVEGIEAIQPTAIAEDSKYFFTYSITSIPYAAFDTQFEVKAYWITKDGTKVYGPSRTGADTLSVNKGIAKNQEVSR